MSFINKFKIYKKIYAVYMKILIVGTGVIGTIYGWALSAAGLDVVHLVRSGKAPPLRGVIVDILDERKGYVKYNKTEYLLKTVDTLDIGSAFDLVIVPTNWCQTQAVLEAIVPKCQHSFFYILTSNWKGADIFDRILKRNQYILGYPDGGGTIKDGAYWTNIGPEIHIAAPSEENKAGFNLINSIFSKANIKLDEQENMLHWLWVHNAGSLPMMVAFQKHKNINQFLNDKKLLKQSFLATRECLALCEKRGAYSNKYPEIAAFKWPMWLLTPIFKYNFKHNESMKRYTAHAERIPKDDILCNYNDILATARELNLNIPNFEELGDLLKQP
jgi:ketopantoate reductase